MHERPVSEMQHQPIADKKDALFNAALDIANQAIDFFHADPTRFISSALTIAKIVIEKIQTAKANQEQLNYLCERIQTALPTLIRLKEDTTAAKQVKLPLLAFKTCLESCYAQAQKYADKHWFKKLIRAGADQQKFQTLALELNDSIAMLDVSLSVEQTVILEKIAHCQLEDKQQIMAKMESIMALEEASLREMKVLRHQHKQMHLEQSEFNVVIGEQLSAIPAAISKQLKLNGEEQTQFIHKQFAMLCKKFHSFEEKERCSTAPPIPAHLSIPYYDLTIDKILKEGSFGTIYLGDWFGITVAVKKIGNRIQGDDYKQFLNELKNLAKFRHPNIIQVYGACLEPEACIVTEYARNRSLVEFLENNKISSAEQVKIIKGLAHALRYLHELGGIHRDLNPSNVLIDEHGEPKLNDFGLSKVMSNTLSTVAHIHFDKRRSTHATSHLEWLSPELLTKGKKATSAADIYSFALIVIYLFTGKSIFQDLPVEKIAFDSLRLAAYKKVASQIPKEFRGLMIECLQPNPELRPEARDVSSNMVSICDQYLSRNSTSFDMLTEKGLHSPKQIYLKGKTLAQRGNNEESFVCIKRAAKAGYSRAQADLGVRLLTGKGCQTNKAKAYAWFMKARKQKHTRAIFNAATMLEYGDGVPLNKGLALKLYKEAQELGNPDAAQKVDELLKSGVNLPISKV